MSELELLLAGWALLLLRHLIRQAEALPRGEMQDLLDQLHELLFTKVYGG